MATCYPPLTVDLDSLDFNNNPNGSGFGATYITPDPSCEPPDCVLPDLISTDLNLSETNLTTPQGGCKFTFDNVFPQPPIYIPKPVIPVIPCPQGVSVEASITIVGSGSASVTGGITSTGGPCNYLIGGIVDIYVPPVPCPSGSSFSSNVTYNSGTSNLSVLGGPCNFALVGNIAPGGGGNDVAAPCLDCTATCCTVRTQIQNQYATLGTTPKQGDIINVCIAVYEVVGTPNPTSTCGGGCPNVAGTLVIDFTVASITYYARQISCKCPATPFFVIVNPAGTYITVLPGTLQTDVNPSSTVSIYNLNTSLPINPSDNVWLQVSFTGNPPVPSAYEVCTSLSHGVGVFDPTAAPWSTNSVTEQNTSSYPYYQTIARYGLASITSSVSTQICFNNLILNNSFIDYYAAIYPKTV